MTLDDLYLESEDLGSDKIVKFVKEKEVYRFYNLSGYFTSYYIVYKGCKADVPAITGGIDINGDFVFIPEREGEFVITFRANNLNDTIKLKETVFIAHYPSIVKSIIKDTTTALCDCSCGCDDNCRSYKDLFAESQLLLNLYRSIGSENTLSILHTFLYRAYDLYRCDFIALFCDKQVDLKLSGSHTPSDRMFKKVTAINYLALYFYELYITNPLQDFVTYHNRKFCFKKIKDCLLKAGIEIFVLQTLFEDIVYESPETPTEPLSCFRNVEDPSEHSYTFLTGVNIDGTTHTVTLRNICTATAIFFDTAIYDDGNVNIKVRNKTGANPAPILPMQVFQVDVEFRGTKTVPTIMTIPFKYDHILINTYKLIFVDPVVANTPPVIVDIIKELNNRDPYTFTVADFENYFTDADGDILDKIVIVGDTSRFTLAGQPYISGTEITRTNIPYLVYTPLDTDNIYQVSLSWMAYDSYGLGSN